MSAYFCIRTPIANLNTCNAGEIDRYITWPGQATAYKTGEMKIRQVRQKMEKTFSDNFDLKDFHRSMLDCFGPLEFLVECVETSMASALKEETRRKKSANNGGSGLRVRFVLFLVMAGNLIF